MGWREECSLGNWAVRHLWQAYVISLVVALLTWDMQSAAGEEGMGGAGNCAEPLYTHLFGLSNCLMGPKLKGLSVHQVMARLGCGTQWTLSFRSHSDHGLVVGGPLPTIVLKGIAGMWKIHIFQ